MDGKGHPHGVTCIARSQGLPQERGAHGSLGSTGVVGATAAPGTLDFLEPPDGKYDFDTVYNRVRHGLHQVGRADQQVREGNIAGRHGHRRHGFPGRALHHQGPRRALPPRELGLPGHAARRLPTVIVGWNKRRYGVRSIPRPWCWPQACIPALIAAIQTFSPPGSQVLLQTPTYNGFYSDLRFARVIAEESPLKLVRRPLLDGLRRFRAADQPRHQHVDSLQSAESDRQLLVAGGADAARGDLPQSPRGRARRRDSLRLRHQGPATTRRSPASRTRTSSTTASRSRRRASRSVWRP